MPKQFIRDRSRNLLSSLGFAGVSAYFAILARVMSTFKELTLRPLRKGYFETSDHLRSPPICCGTARAHLFA